MKNYYQILGVPEAAQEKEIKKAYRNLAKKWHPDKQQDEDKRKEAELKFKEISEAYSVLSHPARRQEYDLSRKGPSAFRFSTTGDPFDLFRHGFGFHRNTQRRADAPAPGATARLRCRIPLAEALFGTEKTLKYEVRSGCPECNGKGAKEFKVCDECQGAGFTAQVGPNMTIQSTCGVCKGSCKIPTKICSKCAGAGTVIENREVDVQLPAGLTHGVSMRITGAGGGGLRGGPAGDALLEVLVVYPDLEKLSKEEKETLKSLLSKE